MSESCTAIIDQLMDNWELAVRKQELFAIEPLK